MTFQKMKEVSSRLFTFMDKSDYPNMPMTGMTKEEVLQFFTALQKVHGTFEYQLINLRIKELLSLMG